MNRNSAIFLLLAIGLIVIVIVIGLGIGLTNEVMLSILISVAALVISILTIAKSTYLPSRMSIIAGDNYIVDPNKPGNLNPGFIIPITFMNLGYGDCVVETLCLILTEEDGTKLLYEPITEIDIKSLIQDQHKVHGTNVVNAYMSFGLFGRSSVKKAFLFHQKLDPEVGPIHLTKQSYHVSIRIKLLKDSKLKERATFTFNADDPFFHSINIGSVSYVMKYTYETAMN